jgi:hypothetical protein
LIFKFSKAGSPPSKAGFFNLHLQHAFSFFRYTPNGKASFGASGAGLRQRCRTLAKVIACNDNTINRFLFSWLGFEPRIFTCF